MSTAPQQTLALMSAQALPAPEADDAPEWVHLLPVRLGAIQTGDTRGPYHVKDAEALIAASFAESDKLPIDQDHATDLASPKGLPAPARGWIVEMQARDDGIWGRVEWTREGAALVRDRAYRALSPVILHAKTQPKIIYSILRASLVNRPNFRGLAALNQQQETDMDFMAKLAEALGLEEGADEAAVLDAITALMAGKSAEGDDEGAALQSQLSEIGKALGCANGADGTAVLNAARAAATAAGDDDAVTALQAELVAVTTELNELTGDRKREKAVAFVDKAILDGRVGVKPMRERHITMHMADPENAEALINGLPKLGGSPNTLLPTPPKDGEIALNAEQKQAVRQLGIDPKAYAATLAAEQAANQETF